MDKIKRKLIYTAIQQAICDYTVNDCSISVIHLKKKPRCLVDVILKYVLKVSPFKSNRFVMLPDGWIRDLTTGLEWGKSSDKSMNFNDAKEYCEKEGGRLPTVDELQTILNRTLYNPTADKNIFKDVKSEWYWTSTKYAGCSGAAWCVSFNDGLVDGIYVYYNNYVRPVRLAGRRRI